jgi:hypothetical protein
MRYQSDADIARAIELTKATTLPTEPEVAAESREVLSADTFLARARLSTARKT